MILYFIILFFAIVPVFNEVQAFVPQKMVLKKEKIAFYTPHIINPKSFALEFGFVADKKIKSINYPFNVFVEAYIAEESYTADESLRAGAFGFKAGFILPTQKWLPIYLQPTFGFARTALHHDPWFGKEEKTIESKTLFLLEGSVLYIYNKRILIRYSYQINNVDYFSKRNFLAVGISF